MGAIYFHIPFCKRLCGYCDFVRSVKSRFMPQTVEAMHRELEQQVGFLKDRKIRTIYFGGGTPSLLHPSEIERFIEHCRALFDCSETEEITVEVNPDDITESYAEAIAATSVNRVSMGVQSFDDSCLQFMGRRHSAEGAKMAIERLRRAGIENISVDIIFGVNGFGGKSLEHTLQQAVATGAEHISAYHLTIEPQTRFGRLLANGQLQQVSEQTSEQEFLTVHQTLTAAGYEHYEVSNFARKGYRSRHNSSYWTGAEYLGIGPGAHSFNGVTRRWCEQDVEQYIKCVEYGSETLTAQDALNEYIMVSLRRVEGIDLQHIAKMWGEESAKQLLSCAERFIACNWLVQEGGRLAVPAEKFLISDTIIGELFA
jgi:oxygen-independent coproporphyrinogen-3 oxidase